MRFFWLGGGLAAVASAQTCPSGKFLRTDDTDSVQYGGTSCGCNDRWIDGIDSGNGVCSPNCSSCACCCGNDAHVTAYSITNGVPEYR